MSPDGSMSQPPLLQVTLSPEVPVAGLKDKVTISGKFAEDITETKFPACTGSGCSIKAGDQYAKTVEIQAPGSIPHLSFMMIAMGNSNTDVIGCAYAEV
ncbi:14746_t:CDS:2 [Funneliformis mosseae]|uniref:14746_t:CDS:1 n=1 Tax=Funneliformis mosseae TaxID=27381 RepID=A0A9N9N6S5_FUNMO|nr:14746_t:CDS:2 [Funneliformis mosseae]